MSAQFCMNMVSSMRQFLKLKFFYIDPWFINATKIINCEYQKNQTVFDYDYNFGYSQVEQCLESNSFHESCYQLC